MRILLDENLDWRLGGDLPGHTIESVPLIGWAGLRNGELLARAQGDFDVLMTMDSGLAYQQNITNYDIAIIILEARSNRLADTQPLMHKVLAELNNIAIGTAIRVS